MRSLGLFTKQIIKKAIKANLTILLTNTYHDCSKLCEKGIWIIKQKKYAMINFVIGVERSNLFCGDVIAINERKIA